MFKSLIFSALLLMAGACAGIATHWKASAATPYNGITALQAWESQFYNYDFNDNPPSGYAVDWTMSLLFWKNADIWTVKHQIYNLSDDCGSPQYAKMNNNYQGWEVDTDSGIKTPCSPVCNQTSYHMRVYAPPVLDKMYNFGWQFFVLASAHRDKNEYCFWGTQYGWSEDAELYFMDTANVPAGNKAYDWSYWYNQEPPRMEGNHYWISNGYTSAVQVGP